MFADSRFDYLSRVRYYTALLVAPVHVLATLPGLAVDSVMGLFQTRGQLEEENARLQEQLLMQQYQLQKLDHLTAENRRLNELLKASTVVDGVVMRAQLTGESPDPFAKRILINKGSADGVYIGQPVLDADGLMGQVMDVEPLTSWVLLISDPQHATPVQVNRNGLRAIAAGTRDSLHFLTLNNVPNTADIETGDVLVTSGLGDRFPAGYPVGVVNSVVRDPGKPFAEVMVAPTALIDRSRNLLLVFENRATALSEAPLETGDSSVNAPAEPAAPDAVAAQTTPLQPEPASLPTDAVSDTASPPEEIEETLVVPAAALDLEGPLLPEAAGEGTPESAGSGEPVPTVPAPVEQN